MQSFANGRPAIDDDLIQEVANKVTSLARRGRGRGMRLNFEWLSDALGPRLARAVLKRAGFRRCPEQWAVGNGDSRPGEFTFPELFAEQMEEIVDDYAYTTLQAQADELNRQGYTTARGGRWHPSSVSNLRKRLAAA